MQPFFFLFLEPPRVGFPRNLAEMIAELIAMSRPRLSASARLIYRYRFTVLKYILVICYSNNLKIINDIGPPQYGEKFESIYFIHKMLIFNQPSIVIHREK